MQERKKEGSTGESFYQQSLLYYPSDFVSLVQARRKYWRFKVNLPKFLKYSSHTNLGIYSDLFRAESQFNMVFSISLAVVSKINWFWFKFFLIALKYFRFFSYTVCFKICKKKGKNKTKTSNLQLLVQKMHISLGWLVAFSTTFQIFFCPRKFATITRLWLNTKMKLLNPSFNYFKRVLLLFGEFLASSLALKL